MTPIERVHDALRRAGKRGRGRDWQCPAHDDRRASLSVTTGRDGRVLLKCHGSAGCTLEAILAPLGLATADLFPPEPGRNGSGRLGPVLASYDYTDEGGRLLFQVVRHAPKDFRQRRPDGAGGWTWKLGPTRRVLYRLPKVLEAARAGQTVYVAEGEKDVHALEQAGVVATCNPGGAGKWRAEYAQALAGARVVVVADRDDPGRDHARQVAASLTRHGCTVHVVEPASGKDAADHLAAGHGLDELVRLRLDGPSPAPAEPAAASSGLALIRIADVKPERVEWVWQGRIPRGKVTVLDGDPGLGKSTFTLDLIARVTTGSPLPTGEPPGVAGSAILLSAEDGVADTIRPRLEVAGADLERVAVIDHVADPDGPRPFALPGDLPQLELAIVEHGAVLVVVDPLMAFLGADVKSHQDQDVRRALHPLKELAERTGAAIVVVRHLNKSGGAEAIYRGGGSIGIIGAARAGLIVAKDPQDEHRRILAVSKSNLAATPPALAYRVVGDELYDTARIVWDGTSELSATDLLRGPDPDAPERDEAETFLRGFLADGPAEAKTVEREARKADIASRTLRRARERLGIKPRKVGKPGEPGFWEWALPEGGQKAPGPQPWPPSAPSAPSASSPPPNPPEDGRASPEGAEDGHLPGLTVEWSPSGEQAAVEPAQLEVQHADRDPARFRQW
jgi:putative DNA primase/helicase